MAKELLPGLSVIVPTYNEEETVEPVVETIRRKLASLAREHEILIVNDGSTDRTRQIVDSLAEKHAVIKVIHHPFNIGYGGAQKSGILSARYDYLTIVPSDGEFQIDDLDKYIEWAKDFDIIVGYRKHRGQDSFFRKTKTKVFKIVMRLLFGITLEDTNWVKLFKKEVFRNMDITSRGICVDAEVIFKAKCAGFSFKEVLVSYQSRKAGVAKGDLPLTVMITIMELLILRFSSWKKKQER